MSTILEVDPYEGMEREAKSREDENIAREICNLNKAFKNIHVHKGCEMFKYEDLCVHPDIEFLVGYKVSNFDMFDREGNPRAYLRLYCDKLVGVRKDKVIRMKFFIRSLIGESFDWYTSQDQHK